jgi:hypothetical protein
MSWEVIRYEHPAIFVRNTAGVVHQFAVSDDMTLESESSRFDRGSARRAAIEYLYKLRQSQAA